MFSRNILVKRIYMFTSPPFVFKIIIDYELKRKKYFQITYKGKKNHDFNSALEKRNIENIYNTEFDQISIRDYFYSNLIEFAKTEYPNLMENNTFRK